jgi:hypothetical protein
MPYGQVLVDTVKDSLNNVLAPASSVFRNRIINGAMVIDQRNAGASVTPANGDYTLDRWKTGNSQASKYSVQQNAGSVTPPVGFSKYLGVTSSSAYAVTSTDYFTQYQPIEGFNFSDLGWGTANAKTITISFQVYSSLTGTFGGTLLNSAGDRCYVFSYSIPTANTWTTISVTVAGDTSGTWVGATNGVGAYVFFSLGAGSSVSGTAGSWGATLYRSVTGATSVVGTSGATWYATGIQLEVGTNTTNFDYRPYGTELALCQRYYFLKAQGNASADQVIVGGGAFSATQVEGVVNFAVPMRTSPSLVSPTVTSAYQATGGSLPATFNSFSAAYGATQNQALLYVSGVTVTANAYYRIVIVSGSTTAYIAYNAEL